MNERGILIADSDTALRREMASYFEQQGYEVETSDSAVHALCTILEKQTPVLLLGTDFDRKISAADLVQLLRRCNRHLAIVLVSEQLDLPQARKLRTGRIFYHALKPASAHDHEEIRQAVECAFESITKKQFRGPWSREQ